MHTQCVKGTLWKAYQSENPRVSPPRESLQLMNRFLRYGFSFAGEHVHKKLSTCTGVLAKLSEIIRFYYTACEKHVCIPSKFSALQHGAHIDAVVWSVGPPLRDRLGPSVRPVAVFRFVAAGSRVYCCGRERLQVCRQEIDPWQSKYTIHIYFKWSHQHGALDQRTLLVNKPSILHGVHSVWRPLCCETNERTSELGGPETIQHTRVFRVYARARVLERYALAMRIGCDSLEAGFGV